MSRRVRKTERDAHCTLPFVASDSVGQCHPYMMRSAKVFEMVKVISASAMLCMLFGVGVRHAAADEAELQLKARAQLELAEEQAFKQAAVLASPWIVRIDTVGGLDIVGQTLTSTAPTSGVIVSEDGFIVSSAFNFLSKPASVLITLPDGRRFPAKTVATDRLHMLTLLKVDVAGLKVPQAAPKDGVRVGQWSIALGRTYDSALPSISVGIVSAVDRVWGKAIQTDAKISPVNYGGPLVDTDGRVMGILVPLSPQGNSESAGVEWYDSGIGFAIPLDDVYAVLDRLKLGKDLRPGLSGVAIKSGDLYAVQPVIDRVRYDSPAHKAGLQTGDTIEKINGQPIKRLVQLFDQLKSRHEGDSIEMTVKRGDETITKQLTLVGELLPYEVAFLGVLPQRENSSGKATDPARTGVGIRFVYPDSPAAASGLLAGDRLLKMNDQAIKSVDDLRDQLSRLRPASEVKLDVEHAGKMNVVTAVLSAAPKTIPNEIPASAAPETAKVEEPETGRFTGKLAGYEDEYWAFVPESYSPDRSYSLLVWLHPSGSTMEATIFREWKTICESRGIILLAPKISSRAGWTPNHTEYVRDVVLDFQKQYSIDTSRVAVHGLGNGGEFAASVAFRFPELFRGIALASAALKGRPPEHSPEFQVQFHLIYGDLGQAAAVIQRTASGLEQLKFPVTLRKVEGHRAGYPPTEAVEEMARWLDALDRF
ncbi:MAG: PDZ domain-containing protein [Planctomycetota bacterium]|nr:PDZ domain-containing protein [Planctomycetota bacterium]MDA1162764.1 PDZ domain-containing protein [Planctomycetota bacterium]